MSSIQIPNLPAATGLNGTEQLEGVQSGTSVKITTNQIATYISSAYPAPGIASVTGSAPIAASTVGNAVTISLNPQGVTNAYLATMPAGTVKANVTGGSASPTNPTVSQVLDVIGSSGGSVLYRGSVSWAALTAGSSGQVLTSGGTGAPSWQTLSVPSGQIAPTGVTAGTYGSASTVPQFTVLASGQISSATNVSITIPYTSVTGLGSMATQSASAVAITGGTIDGTTIGSVTPRPASFTSLTATGPTNVATIASGVWNGTAIGVSYGGTGATTASGARSNLGAAASGANSDITSLSGLTTPLSETQGGTGYGSYTTGDILYANSSTTLARLNDVATGNALISGGVGVAPSWGKIGLTTHVSGTLPVANGGTGATTLTGYVYGNGTGAFTAATTIPNAGLTNSSVTIGSTSIALGGTVTTLAGLTTVTLTQDPTLALQASTKQYVDGQVAAVSNTTFHASSGYATTADLGTVTYSNGTGGVGATITNAGTQTALTIDGYTFTGTDVSNATRVLVKNQSSGLQNGIYTVTNQGSGSTNWVLTRATDFNTVGTGPNFIETGASTFVTGGAGNGSTGWVMNTTGTITVGSTALVWVQSSSSASVTVTSPLTKVGSVISLGTVPTTLGGTGLTTLTQYNVMLGNGTGNVAFAAPSTTGYPLLSTGASSNPAFGQLSLTAGVTGTLPVANGGTGTATAFTTGSVVFAGASGTYSQNNTKFFWDNTNNRLGINTGSPQTQLTVVANTQTTTPTGTLPAGTDIYIVGANAANTRITQDAYGTGAYGVFTARHARGTAASPTATQANDFLAQFTARGYGATAFGTASTGYIAFSAAENFTDTAQGTYAGIYTTPIGSNSIVEAFRFGPAGQLGIGGATYGTSGYVLTSGGASAAPTWSQVSATSLSGVLPVANGGTNISSYTIGDLIYASGTTTLSKLADVATGNALISGGVGVAPSWGKIGLTTHVSGTLPIANGGTNLTSTPTNGQLLIGNSTGYSLGTLTAGSSNFVVTNGSGSITLDINSSPTLTGLTVNGPAVISTSSSSDALRITQTGAGNAILVEDSANPDSTPFVVNASGQVLVGATTAPFGSTNVGIFNSAADTAPAYQDFFKNRAGATTVSGDGTGQNRFWAYDGTTYLNTAAISSSVDGTVSTGDAPGRLSFFTRAVGGSGVTERMRIDNAGAIGIGTSTLTGYRLRVAGSATGSTTMRGISSGLSVQSDVTAEYRSIESVPNLTATVALTSLSHFYANEGSYVAGYTLTNSYGFHATNGLIGATNNYGFYGNIASSSGRWNFFANGTANNAFNGNSRFGGITAPSYAVDVTGSVNASTSVISPLHIGGTAVSSTLTLQSTSGAGTSDAIIFQTGSQTERMRITTAGNVGIGTSSPGELLSLAGSANVYASILTTGGVKSQLFSSDATGGGGVGTATNHFMALYTNNTERMRIDAAGSVFINSTGGTGTGEKFLVKGATLGTTAGNTSVNSAFWTPDTTNTTRVLIQDYRVSAGSDHTTSRNLIQRRVDATNMGYVGFDSSATSIGWGTTEAMRVDSSGNVGIGTSSPSVRLNAYVASGDCRLWAQSSTVTAQLGGESGGTAYVGTYSNNPLVVRINDTERMRVDTSGNVLVGGTTAFGKLSLYANGVYASSGSMNSGMTISNGTGGGALNIGVNDTGTGSTSYTWLNSGYINSSNSPLPFVLATGSSERFRIGTSGQLGVAGANYGTSGQVLTSGGASAAPSWSTPTGGFSNLQVFTSSGTFTVPAGITKVKVTVIGGGGGGGYGGAGSRPGGLGGAAGGASIKIVSGLTPAGTVAVTVGTGGAGSSSAARATSGGSSSFGAYCSATGGAGGWYSSGGGIAAGGVGSSGDLNINGSAGGVIGSDIGAGAGAYNGYGGDGGSSILGGGGAGGSYGDVNTAATAGGAYGGGGGGSAGPVNANGAAGAAGVVIVEY